MSSNSIDYSHVKDLQQIEKIIQLQRDIWKDNATPLTQLVAAQSNGGVIITASLNGDVIGFCYGFPGFNNGQNYLVSHMLAIHPDYRDLGIGMRLKYEQRNWALRYGYKKIVWTFDPLESRNAYLNLCKLGGYVQKYIENYYGNLSDELNDGLPTDRFLLEWELDSTKTLNAAKGISYHLEQDYPILLDAYMNADLLPIPYRSTNLDIAESVLVAVPSSIQVIKQKDFEVAKEWRFQLRNVVQYLFNKDYIILSLIKNKEKPIHYYYFEQKK